MLCACVFVKWYLTNDRRHVARRGKLLFISTRGDCFIVCHLWMKPFVLSNRIWRRVLKSILTCLSAYIVCVFPHFDPSCEFYPTELRRIGPVIHLLHGPYAIVIALVQCWFFIRHLLPKSPGSFSFIRLSLERQYWASHGHAYGPSRQNFIPKWASDKWAELKPMRRFGKEWFRLSGSVLFTQVSCLSSCWEKWTLTSVKQREPHGNVLVIFKNGRSGVFLSKK